MLINSFSAGETIIYAEIVEDGLESNRVSLQVLRIRSTRIEPEEIEVEVGSRTKLRAVCTMSNGEHADDVALIWTEDNASIARVATNGTVFGASPGETEVYVGDDKVTSENAAKVRVIEAEPDSNKGKGSGKGRKKGRGYPLILVSGEVDTDPETDEYVHFSPDDPPVMQRPQDADRNIWWINSVAPLAKMYLDKELGYGYTEREWRMYHLERYMNIISQIAMTYDPNIDGKLTVGDFFLYTADKAAEIQAAIAVELIGFIRDGTVPEA